MHSSVHRRFETLHSLYFARESCARKETHPLQSQIDVAQQPRPSPRFVAGFDQHLQDIERLVFEAACQCEACGLGPALCVVDEPGGEVLPFLQREQFGTSLGGWWAL